MKLGISSPLAIIPARRAALAAAAITPSIVTPPHDPAESRHLGADRDPDASGVRSTVRPEALARACA